ncbi:MAG TPA: LPS assembly protein LptD [Caulobacteraceae bacterium]|nr:LPS assembly protein LptD [Caulobacteraceae bacterium]
MRVDRSGRIRLFGSILFATASATVWLVASAAAAQSIGQLPVRIPGQAAPGLPIDLQGPPTPAPVPKQLTDDGLHDRGFYLEADTLIRNDKTNRWTARGGVEARYQGRTLRADSVVYDVATGVVTADGDVQIINADDTAEYAKHVVLDDKMRAGFAEAFSARLPLNGKIAAAVAVRRSATVEELDRAVFTPCDICADDGRQEQPTWSIQASTVIEDQQRHLVYYRNAIIRIKGLPVFFAPVLFHPDPTAPRASGLLVPRVSFYTKERGTSYEQPILWVINPSTELLFSPQINSKVNPFLNLDWRERFYSGALDVRAGYTYEADFDSNGRKFGPEQSRAYILANGQFDLSANWSWGFTADRTSDPLLFQKYDVPSAYADHGLFLSDSQRLLSQIYVTRQDQDSYLQLAALDVQGLRVTDNNRTFPLVAPFVEGRWDAPFNVLGGRLQLVGNAVMLNFDESPVAPTLSGAYDRASGELNWLSTYTTANGIRAQPFLDLRADVFDVRNLTLPTRSATVTQGLATGGVTVSWPFIRQAGGTTIVLEPIAQIALSPDYNANRNIPNEDDVIFEYDESDLFSPEKFNGFDLYEGGQRLNLGGEATFEWGDGLSANLVFGRTFRAQRTNVFPQRTGLDGTASDWVIAAEATPIDGVSAFGRALINDALSIERVEVGVNYATARIDGYFRYLDDNTQITGPVRNLETGNEILVTRHWGFDLDAIRDIEINRWTLVDFGILYKDDCVKVAVVYRHQSTVVGRLGESDSVFLRLTLATLGGQAYDEGLNNGPRGAVAQ